MFKCVGPGKRVKWTRNRLTKEQEPLHQTLHCSTFGGFYLYEGCRSRELCVNQ